MKTTEKTACRIIIDVLTRSGVKDVVISPGSRNTPLILAADADESLRKHVVIDERAAAFYALGLSEISRRPVALICTSGSAPLNYAPALSEAYYRGVPLIALTADRSFEWIDQDDSQTIRQFRCLENVVKKSYDIPEMECATKDFCWFVNRTVNDAVIEAVRAVPGPVHINVQLREPLGKTGDFQQAEERIISEVGTAQKLDDSVIKILADTLADKRVLLIAGFMEPDHKLQSAVSRFASLPNVAVMAETLSNLYLEPECYSIDKVLSTLSAAEKMTLRPDIIITLGGALVSRLLKEYLRGLGDSEYRPEHWSIGHHRTTVDCLRLLTKRIEITPGYLLRKLYNNLSRRPFKSSYKSLWHQYRTRAKESAETFISAGAWSELKIFHQIFKLLPDGINLQLSNGTPVRYNQLLASTPYHSTHCNRGVSGIDGCTSTAVGASRATERPTILITGDMSFTYDLSALTIKEVPDSFKIILINNSGGGIFRFIKSTSELDSREKYFSVAPGIDVESISRGVGYKYLRAHDEESLTTSLRQLFQITDAPAILEVMAPGNESGEILKAFMNRELK